MISSIFDDENTTFDQSLKSFRSSLEVENEDTKAILNYLEFGLTSLNKKLELNSAKYDEKLMSMDKRMSHKYKKLGGRINATDASLNDLRKELDVFKAQVAKNIKNLDEKIYEENSKLSKQSMQEFHGLQDMINQNGNLIHRIKQQQENDTNLLIDKIERYKLDTDNKYDELNAFMKEKFAIIMKEFSAFSTFLYSKYDSENSDE